MNGEEDMHSRYKAKFKNRIINSSFFISATVYVSAPYTLLAQLHFFFFSTVILLGMHNALSLNEADPAGHLFVIVRVVNALFTVYKPLVMLS